jgi:hypothetical protein
MAQATHFLNPSSLTIPAVCSSHLQETILFLPISKVVGVTSLPQLGARTTMPTSTYRWPLGGRPDRTWGSASSTVAIHARYLGTSRHWNSTASIRRSRMGNTRRNEHIWAHWDEGFRAMGKLYITSFSFLLPFCSLPKSIQRDRLDRLSSLVSLF